MISIPIWLFVLFCIFGFMGLCLFLVIIYGLIISAVKPIHYEENIDELEN